ncbi:hypothetical protein FH972_002700 [Carpinus fangiana]|uniref:Uncharacterized protein n=1 Tax=Carpinus fangiana TaxID=176857 RepID=A0A5N6QG67_9ROSI|nr:hypothetical protein FH972_002700 [Carpinus fangiana]
MQRAQLRSSGPQFDPQSASVFKKKASTSKASTGKEIHIPHLDEREHTPPLGFVDERRGLSPTGAADEGRASPPPWICWRACIKDSLRRSDRIAGICRTVRIKNTGPIHIDIIEDLGNESESIARRVPRTRGGATLGAARKGPKTRGGAAIGGTTRGGAATDGAERGGAATRGGGLAARGSGTTATGGGAAGRGGGAARGGVVRGGRTTVVKGRGGGNVSSSNQAKGKRIVTSIEKGIEIMESKRKRKERDWKP